MYFWKTKFLKGAVITAFFPQSGLDMVAGMIEFLSFRLLWTYFRLFISVSRDSTVVDAFFYMLWAHSQRHVV